MSTEHLQSVLDRIAQTADDGTLPLVVFDLDSTLFSTRPRNLRILRDFADTRPRDADLQRIVSELAPDDFGWEVTKPLEARGYADPEGLKALGSFWFKRFFTDEYVTLDPPNEGAVEFAQAAHDRGAFLYYLTGRHVHGMSQGTVHSLTQHGFPFWRGRTSLHLKPDFKMDDTAYKREALADIRSHQGNVVATFENEPANANMFLRAFPEAMHFLLQTEHSPNPERPHEHIVQIPSFLLG